MIIAKLLNIGRRNDTRKKRAMSRKKKDDDLSSNDVLPEDLEEQALPKKSAMVGYVQSFSHQKDALGEVQTHGVKDEIVSSTVLDQRQSLEDPEAVGDNDSEASDDSDLELINAPLIPEWLSISGIMRKVGIRIEGAGDNLGGVTQSTDLYLNDPEDGEVKSQESRVPSGAREGFMIPNLRQRSTQAIGGLTTYLLNSIGFGIAAVGDTIIYSHNLRSEHMHVKLLFSKYSLHFRWSRVESTRRGPTESSGAWI